MEGGAHVSSGHAGTLPGRTHCQLDIDSDHWKALVDGGTTQSDAYASWRQTSCWTVVVCLPRFTFGACSTGAPRSAASWNGPVVFPSPVRHGRPDGGSILRTDACTCAPRRCHCGCRRRYRSCDTATPGPCRGILAFPLCDRTAPVGHRLARRPPQPTLQPADADSRPGGGSRVERQCSLGRRSNAAPPRRSA